MPELPEVETVRRGLAPTFVGGRIARAEARRPDLRFPLPERFVGRLTGRRVEDLRRRAKYLLADLDSGETLVMHLGMSGSFRLECAEKIDGLPIPSPLVGEGKGGGAAPLQRGFAESAALAATPHPGPPPQGGRETAPGDFYYDRSKAAAHDHIVLYFENGARVVYNDPRRFGYMDLVATSGLEAHPLFADIGLEPLGAAFDAAALSSALQGSRAPLKAALLDQRRIAGLGNIYVCEALYRARLSPMREAGGLKPVETRRLLRAIREVLEAAIEAGGSTLRDHRQADGTLGYFQHAFAVYDREGVVCRHKRCGGIIARAVQSGRSTFYCSACQQ
jgi:formamidopyrimidine-DNA glycosylase